MGKKYHWLSRHFYKHLLSQRWTSNCDFFYLKIYFSNISEICSSIIIGPINTGAEQEYASMQISVPRSVSISWLIDWFNGDFSIWFHSSSVTLAVSLSTSCLISVQPVQPPFVRQPATGAAPAGCGEAWQPLAAGNAARFTQPLLSGPADTALLCWKRFLLKLGRSPLSGFTGLQLSGCLPNITVRMRRV